MGASVALRARKRVRATAKCGAGSRVSLSGRPAEKDLAQGRETGQVVAGQTSLAEPNALAAGLASGFGSGVARLSEILLRPDASAFGSKEAPMDKGCFQAPRLSPCGICMPLGVFFL